MNDALTNPLMKNLLRVENFRWRSESVDLCLCGNEYLTLEVYIENVKFKQKDAFVFNVFLFFLFLIT